MTDHGYFEELITAGLDGELSQDEARELRAHLETCERCRNFKAAMEAVGGLAERDLPAPPAGLKENVMAAVRAAGQNKKKGRIIPFPVRGIAVAAAAALVVLAGTRVLAPKGSSAAAGVQMSMAVAESADAAPTEDAGNMRTAGSGEAAFDAVNGLMAAPAAAPEAAEAEEAAPVPEPAEAGAAVRYVVFDAAGEALFTAGPDELPEGLLTPDKPCPVPDREPDYTVQTDGEGLAWLLWEQDGDVIVETPDGVAGYTSPEALRAFLER